MYSLGPSLTRLVSPRLLLHSQNSNCCWLSRTQKHLTNRWYSVVRDSLNIISINELSNNDIDNHGLDGLRSAPATLEQNNVTYMCNIYIS